MAGNPPRTAYTPTPAQNAFFGRAAGGSGGGGAINPFFGAPSAALQQVQAAALPSPTSALPAAAATPVLPLATPFNPREVEYRQGLGQGVADARERLEDTQERRGFAEDPNALSLMQQRLQLTQQLGAETARLSRMELAAKASTLDSPEHLSQLREEIALQKEQTQYEEKLSQLRRNLGAGNQPTLMQRVQRALPALQGVGATASALGQLAQTPTSAMGTPGEALSRAGGALGNIGQALTPFLPVAGGVVSALGSVVGGLGALAKAFQDVKPSLAELTSEMERAQGIRSRIAREGAPSGEDIRRTFGPTVARDIERLQNQGQGGQALGIVRGQTAEARQEVSQLERGNLGELRSEVEAELFRQLDRYRSGATNGTFTTAAGTAQANLQGRLTAPAGAGGAGGGWGSAVWGRSLRQGIEIPQEYRNLDFATATPEQIRQMAAAMTTGQLTRAQQRVTVGEAVGREGNIASLRPGAFGVRDLPNLFQSRQGDVLDIHSQIQQEAVRDQREEARFQEQMNLWQQILEEQRRITNGNGNPGGGAQNLEQVGANVGGLFQQWGQAWGWVPAVGPG